MTKLDEAKVTLIEFCINSIDNGVVDEDVQKELAACFTIANSIKGGFDKHLVLTQLHDMVRERVEGNATN